MTRYYPIKVPVGDLSGFFFHGPIYTVLGNINQEDQNDLLSVEGDQVPRKSLVKGGPWAKAAGPQKPWCCFRLGELIKCQKQLGVTRIGITCSVAGRLKRRSALIIDLDSVCRKATSLFTWEVK